MFYKILADIILIIHFLWILFMISGFILAIAGFWKKKLFCLRFFRIAHLIGIIYIGYLSFRRKYCPLTIWEYQLRLQCHPELEHPGSFIIYHLENLVYPGINPLILQTSTVIIAIVTLIIFILKPPRKFS